MADFCKECAEDMFGVDTKDLAGLITEQQVKDGFVMPVICEGCGFIYVDHEGKRVEIPEDEEQQ